jgi:outer membrane lipoprotein-sorting protein
MRKFNRHSFIIMSIFCLCLLLQGQRAAAQVASGSRAPKPEELLDRMRQALDALGAAEFTFEFRAENGAGDLLGEESGRFIAQGECFRLEGSVLTVYCDGVSKWIYDEGAQEITVFPHDTASTDPAENPLSCARRVPGTTLSADRCAEQQRLWTGRVHGSCPWPPRTAMRPIS